MIVLILIYCDTCTYSHTKKIYKKMYSNNHNNYESDRKNQQLYNIFNYVNHALIINKVNFCIHFKLLRKRCSRMIFLS